MIKDKNQLLGAIDLIGKRMFETRPREDIALRPYIKPDFATRNLRHNIRIDLGKAFPEAKCGDYVYVSVAMKASDDSHYAISSCGMDKAWLNGEEIVFEDEKKDFGGGKGFRKAEVNMHRGLNSLVFKCVCTEEGFLLDYITAHIYWPFLWICDYLLWARDTVPMEEYADEQGFALSELVKSGENKSFTDCDIVFPKPSAEDNIIDFASLYGEEDGEYAFALSYAKAHGTLDIKSENNLTVYINGKKTDSLAVSEGDEILISCRRGGKWGFECASNSILHLPPVTTGRKNGTHWLLLGAMASSEAVEVQFKKPYSTVSGDSTFWRFADKNVYLRPYLDTCFFGQWFYGLMVGEYGLLRASAYDSKYYDYFHDSMRILAEYYPYMQYEGKLYGDSTFLKRSVKTHDLDSIGTIGMNLYELYIREQDETLKADIRYVLDRLAESVFKHIPRMEDGTFYRVHTLWADDTYMSCPFLVRMGNLTGDPKYYDEVILQLNNYKKYLYIDEYNVFSHIYFPEDSKANKVPWGRGNGWVYMSLAEVIEHLPEDYKGREELVNLFKTSVEALLSLQGDNGMWHQVLTKSETYDETSCTALFSVAIAKGIKMGLLDKSTYLPVIEKAVDGILNNSVAPNGDIYGVCRGSGCCYDWEYYAQLGTVCGDDHGTGIVLAAICELIELKY